MVLAEWVRLWGGGLRRLAMAARLSQMSTLRQTGGWRRNRGFIAWPVMSPVSRPGLMMPHAKLPYSGENRPNGRYPVAHYEWRVDEKPLVGDQEFQSAVKRDSPMIR